MCASIRVSKGEVTPANLCKGSTEWQKMAVQEVSKEQFYLLKWFIYRDQENITKKPLWSSQKVWVMISKKSETESKELRWKNVRRWQGSYRRGSYWWGHNKRASSQAILKSEAAIVKECPVTWKKKTHGMLCKNAEKRKRSGNNGWEDDRYGGQDFNKRQEIFFSKKKMEQRQWSKIDLMKSFLSREGLAL